MLALEPNRTVSADRLAEGLWGEAPPASAPKMVQLYVSRLRRVLDGNGAEIVTRGRGYELRLPDDDGRRDPLRAPRRAAHAARRALALWRGAALADVADEPFAAAEIRRLDELRLRAIELADRRRTGRGPPRRADRRARRAGRARTRCTSVCTRSACSRSIARAARPTRWRPTARRARRSSSRSASSPAPSCGSCTRRSSRRTRRWTHRRRADAAGAGAAAAAAARRGAARPARRPAACLLAGVLAFAVIRVLHPTGCRGSTRTPSA